MKIQYVAKRGKPVDATSGISGEYMAVVRVSVSTLSDKDTVATLYRAVRNKYPIKFFKIYPDEESLRKSIRDPFVDLGFKETDNTLISAFLDDTTEEFIDFPIK